MNNWIDRYIYAVCEKLPKKQRESSEKELRSYVNDAINKQISEKRILNSDSDEEIFKVLIELGSPVEMAEKYYPKYKYLIGPELIELYRLLVFLIVSSVCIGIVVSTFVSIICAQGSYDIIFSKLPVQLISASLIATGAITVVFALIQYFNNEHGFSKINWHPNKLRNVPIQKNRLRRRETIIAVCFTTLAIVIFNLFPTRISIYSFNGDQARIIPLFHLNMLKQYMAYFNIFWVVQILVYAYHIKTKQWTTFSRLVTIIISLGTLWVILKMASNPAILNVGLNNVIIPSNMLPITNFAAMLFKGFLAIIMVTTAYEVVRHFYYMIRK